MIFNFCLFILVSVFISSSTAAFCSDLTSTDDKDKPCFLAPPTRNPARLRSSGNSLILPCHVARSKRATIEWWYQDFQKVLNHQIYPVFPPVRPTVLRFITSTPVISKNSNETDIMDVSILLRHVNVDDSGIYRCVIRPWIADNANNMEGNLFDEDSDLTALSYHVELTAPRLCQASLGALPCFSSMRTSSPTIIDGYQTAFLQCVVHNHNRPVSVFWVVGNESVNSVLITNHLQTNHHNGDELRRVFPLSPFDYSIELTLNRNTRERTYSCVIDGATDVETTLFTYIVRSLDFEGISDNTIKTRNNETIINTESSKDKSSSTTTDKMISHDALSPQEIDELRHKNLHKHKKPKHENSNEDDELEFFGREETSTMI